MAMQLYKHNQTAYSKAAAMLAETGKAAVIHPSGTGKSFIGFRLCAAHPESRILWLSPSDFISRAQRESWAAEGGDPLNHVTFLTYAALMRMEQDALSGLHPDYIVLDRLHSVSADTWQMSVKRLPERFPAASILGLLAADVHDPDHQRERAAEFFENHIASEMTLGEAIVRGILNPPEYILSLCPDQPCLIALEQYEKRVQSAESKALRDEAGALLDALRRAREQADGPAAVFERYIPDRHGKYIVFTPDSESIQKSVSKAKACLGRIDPQMHIYAVSSDDPAADRSVRDFRTDVSDRLRLLCCTEALSAGISPSDISGVILLRTTVSPLSYQQLIGRALSVSKTRDPVIFDIRLYAGCHLFRLPVSPAGDRNPPVVLRTSYTRLEQYLKSAFPDRRSAE